MRRQETSVSCTHSALFEFETPKSLNITNLELPTTQQILRNHCQDGNDTPIAFRIQSTDILQSAVTGKVKAQQLWGKNKDELAKQLEELKAELVQLRTQKISGGAQSKLNKMYGTSTMQLGSGR